MDANKLGAVRQLQKSFPALTVSEARQLLQECNWNVRSALSAAEAREQQQAAQDRSSAANFFVGGAGRGGSAQQVEAPPPDFRAMAASLLAQMNATEAQGGHGQGAEKVEEQSRGEDARSIIEKLFAQAGSEAGGAASGGGAGDSEVQAFYGRGQRLGYTSHPSPYMASTLRPKRDVTIAVYRNGFHLEEDNLFIALDSPEGAEFAASLQREHVPALLARRYPDTDITASMRDVQTRDYAEADGHAAGEAGRGGGRGGAGGAIPSTFFQGTGRRLAEDARQGSSDATGTAASMSHRGARSDYNDTHAPRSSPGDYGGREFHLAEGEESVSVMLVTTAGKKEEVKVNPARHTVEDLFFLAHRLQPELADFDLVVRDMPPRRLEGVSVRAQTIEEAKLKRAVVTIRAK